MVIEMEYSELSEICSKMIEVGENTTQLPDGTMISIAKIHPGNVYFEATREWG